MNGMFHLVLITLYDLKITWNFGVVVYQQLQIPDEGEN